MNRPAALLCACVTAVTGFAVGYLPHLTASKAKVPLYYIDPMHPAYRSAKPGKAPDCGMDLVPVYEEDIGSYLNNDTTAPGALHVDFATQQRYGIRTTIVGGARATSHIHLFGRVVADDTRIYRVNLGTEGYVKETHGDAVGERVHKDQRLATVYSPDFLSVVGGYLSANDRAPALSGSMNRENLAPTANAASAQARADRLRNLGMSDAQIEEIGTTRKIPEDVYVVAPIDGLITARDVSQGSRFDRHTNLYTITDFSHVWIVGQAFGPQADALRPGTIAEIRVPDTGEILKARVSHTLPEVDPETHAATVRLEATNPGLRLRPGMLVDIQVTSQHPSALLIPADAVLDTGASKHVFVETSEGIFVPRDVQTGVPIDDRIPVLQGLKQGEVVASEGTFLLDSESTLRQHSASADPTRSLAEHHHGSPSHDGGTQ